MVQNVFVPHSFLVLSRIPPYGYTYHISFVRSDKRVSCFYLLAIMNSGVLNIHA